MRIALSEMVVEGIQTNIPLHQELLHDLRFIRGGTSHPLPRAEARRGDEEEEIAPVPWLSITLELDPAQAEALSDALLEAGADSVALEPAGRGACAVTALARRRYRCATRWSPPPPRAAALPPPEFTAWRGSRTRTGCGARNRSSARSASPNALWIVPSWHEPPDPAALVVRLDPGLAFGTGSHASTRLVLQYLEAHPARAGRARVLDYGCGSGILAIVAAQARRRGDRRRGHRSRRRSRRRRRTRRATASVLRVARPESTACRNLRPGPGQHPRRSPDRARAAARGAHARRRPHRAVGHPAMRRPTEVARGLRARFRRRR